MGRRRILRGIVVSDKMDKTITVEVKGLKPHRFYHKVLSKITVVKAHNPENKAHTGDIVEIIESRPISKTKKWALYKIIPTKSKERSEELENDTKKLDT